MGVTRLAYDVEGWGRGELWATDGRLVWHELPRPREPLGPPRASSRSEGGLAAGAPVREADRWRGSGGTGRFPQQPGERQKAVTDGQRERVGSVTIAGVVARIRAYFAGERVAFDDVEIDLEWCTPFQRSVADALRAVLFGETVTYGELAALAGHPNAQRAAGTFCAGNRFGLVIPCHRVVGANGLGSYGYLGVDYKRRLLELEGAL